MQKQDIPSKTLFERAARHSQVSAVRYSQVPLGLVDEPDQLSQRPLLVDLLGEEGRPNSGGPLLIVGAQGYGKGTALRTLMLWLAMRFTPDELKCVILDPNGDLQAFKDLDIIYKDEDGERCYVTSDDDGGYIKACEQFERLYNEQKDHFKGEGTRSKPKFSKLRMEPAPAPMCLLIVALHDTIAIETNDKNAVNKAIGLAQRAQEYGVSAIVTTTTYKVSSMAPLTEALAVGFKNRIVLHADASSRSTLLTNAQSRVVEEIEGRGFALIPREKTRWTQLALPVPGRTREDQDKALKDILTQIKATPGYTGW